MSDPPIITTCLSKAKFLAEQSTATSQIKI
jgi:hypothetical protein